MISSMEFSTFFFSFISFPGVETIVPVVIKP